VVGGDGTEPPICTELAEHDPGYQTASRPHPRATASPLSLEEHRVSDASRRMAADDVVQATVLRDARLRYASLAQAARGEFATDEDIHADWAKSASEDPLRASGAPAVGEPDALHAKGAQVPFMITRAQKDALRKQGFDEDQISNMTPAKAHDLLGVK
jgi:hypothetical protein